MDGVGAAAPAHLLLREQTRDAHDAAEATASMRRLLSGEMDEAGYLSLLTAQWQLFDAWEHERVTALEAIGDQWTYASRATALANDLVGGRLRPKALPPEPSVASSLPQSLRGMAGFWGELYVIEGSALGGRVIVKFLRERFPTLPHTFYALGETDPGAWRRFQHVLDTALPDTHSQQLAIAGAQRMFARFQRTLQDPDPHG